MVKVIPADITPAVNTDEIRSYRKGGHCTGIPAFELMKEIMGEKLIALHSGEQII